VNTNAETCLGGFTLIRMIGETIRAFVRVDVEFKIDPLRFWLVAFKKADTDETFYAVVLPDATVVEPEDETKV